MHKTMKTVLLLIGILLSLSVSVPAQNEIEYLYSPDFLAGGASTVSRQLPQADSLNPALSAGNQRPTLDASYLALAGLGMEAGWGHIANIGASFPSRVGVFGAAGRFISSGLSEQNYGTLADIQLSFAKDLYPDLYIGAGLGFLFGSSWGLDLDLGFLHLPGDLGPFQNFRWGIAMRGLGKAYDSPMGPIPPNFTPALGVGFDLIDTEAVNWSFTPDVSFPTFSDMHLVVGTELSLFDTVSLHGACTLDVGDTINGTAPKITLSFGVGFKV